jgi:UPF0716 protein FxsA
VTTSSDAYNGFEIQDRGPEGRVVRTMNLLGRLMLLFVIVPVIELMLLIELGQYVGFLPTLLLVMATGIGGAALARLEGLRVFYQFQQELAKGQIPGQALLDGISVLIGGAFLLTPGILTDFVGFSLLFPPSRRWIQRLVRARLEQQIKDGGIQVMSMGPGVRFGFGGGFPGGASGFGGVPTSGQGPETGDPVEEQLRRPLDPTQGIVVEQEEE